MEEGALGGLFSGLNLDGGGFLLEPKEETTGVFKVLFRPGRV